MASNLPHGHLRALGIAIGLATNPTVLLLDEPFAGMNHDETMRAVNMVRAVRDRGVTVLLVEHDMPAVMRISDRIVVLNFGEKIAEGTPAEIQSDPKSDRGLSRQRRRIDRDLTMETLLKFSDVELYYDHVYALKGVSVELARGRDGRAHRGERRWQVVHPARNHRASPHQERLDPFRGTPDRCPEPRRYREPGHRNGPRGPASVPLYVGKGQPADGRLHT